MKSVITAGMFLMASAAYGDLPSEEEMLEQQLLGLGDQRQECIDLSGDWQGPCEISRGDSGSGSGGVSTETKDVSVAIEQTECSKLKLGDRKVIEIGAISNDSTFSEVGARTYQQGTMWNTSGDALVVFSEINGGVYDTNTHFETTATGRITMPSQETLKIIKKAQLKKHQGEVKSGKKMTVKISCLLDMVKN